MRAVEARRPGPSEVLEVVHRAIPRPKANQVLVHLAAIGVNYADIMCRRGSHPGMPAPPIVLGCEGAGIVEDLGPGVTRLRRGDRVGVYSPWGGSYAEWLNVPEAYALGLPDAMSFEDAAAFTHVYLTAYHALRTLGHACSDEWLVVTAAAGGLGTACIQLAQVWRLRVIAGVGSSAKFPALQRLGVEHTVDYSKASLAERVREITGDRGADLVLETVGGDIFRQAAMCLAPLGRVLLTGVASGEEPVPDLRAYLSRCGALCTVNLSVIFAHAPERIDSSWKTLLEIYSAGHAHPIIGHRFPLEEARQAQELMESRRSVGKILLLPES